MIDVINNILFKSYFSILYLNLLLGIFNFKKFSANKYILFLITILVVVAENIGLIFSNFSINNNFVFIVFDFVEVSLFIKFYVLNLKSTRFNLNYLLVLNLLLFFSFYLIFTNQYILDFIYTLYYTLLILLLGLYLIYEHLIFFNKNKFTLTVNILIIFFVLLTLVNKFLTYYSFNDNPSLLSSTKMFVMIYNILGFSLIFKLLLSKNEN